MRKRTGRKTRTWKGEKVKLRTAIFLLVLPLAPVGRSEPAADYEAGVALLPGKTTAADTAAAREAFERASSQGHVLAKVQLAILLSNGSGGPRDDTRALALFSEAAETGQREALYNKGLFLLQGRGAPRDLSVALEALGSAAAAGSVHAHIKLADIFYFGDRDLKADRGRALPHVKAAAMAGDAWACNILGTMAEQGYEMPMDRKMAISWFTVAARKNNIKAQANLGRMLKEGNRTSSDKVAAYKWLSLA
ncbi:MAG: sel1 repeat family protein, partial [Verrucomicrobiaceae bacterium]